MYFPLVEPANWSVVAEVASRWNPASGRVGLAGVLKARPEAALHLEPRGERRPRLGLHRVERHARVQLDQHESATRLHFKYTKVGDDEADHTLPRDGQRTLF